MEQVGTRARAPWHLWAVGIGSLLWNLVGAVDYTLSAAGSRAYLEGAGMGPDDIAWLAAMPAWATASWALAVWGAMLGSLLLLARSRWAATAYVVSLIGVVPTLIFQYTSDLPPSMTGTFPLVMSVAIVVLTLAQLWYAIRMRRAGVLR